jgi:hypothetical protein
MKKLDCIFQIQTTKLGREKKLYKKLWKKSEFQNRPVFNSDSSTIRKTLFSISQLPAKEFCTEKQLKQLIVLEARLSKTLERVRTKMVAFNEKVNEKHLKLIAKGKPFNIRNTKKAIEFLTESSGYSEYLNYPIQAASADMTKYLLVNYDFNYVLQIHDEVVIIVKEEFAQKELERLKKSMIEAGKVFITKVPVEVDAKISKVWTK